MSFNNPGYVPPPPAATRRARSPWMFVGIGCGTLAVLFTILIAVLAGGIAQNMKKPLDVVATKKAMGDTPVYPGAKFDENMTKGQRAALGITRMGVPSDDAAVIAYSTEDTGDKVLDWYSAEMEKRGFHEVTNVDMSKFGQSMHQGQFRKGNEVVMVQTQANPRDKSQILLVVIRFTGVKTPDK